MEPDKPGPLLQLRGVTKVYINAGSEPRRALDHVSLDIYPGELVSVVGPSGCGKTTLLKLVAGFIDCTEGEILVNGEPIEGPSPDRTMIFQEHNLFPWKTVRQNVEFGLKARGLNRAQRSPIIQKYISLVRLDGFENSLPHQLSGGMRQRVAVARALALEPACILMDEPLGALDAQLRSTLQNQLLDILATERPTVLFVTHDIEEAIYLSDRMVVLSRRPGRVLSTTRIPFPRPRKAAIKLSSEFQDLRSLVLTQLE